MAENFQCDVLVVGSGGAGLMAARHDMIFAEMESQKRTTIQVRKHNR